MSNNKQIGKTPNEKATRKRTKKKPAKKKVDGRKTRIQNVTVSADRTRKIIAAWKSGDYEKQSHLRKTKLCLYNRISRDRLSKILKGVDPGENALIVQDGIKFHTDLQGLSPTEAAQVTNGVLKGIEVEPLRQRVVGVSSELVELVNTLIYKAKEGINKHDRLTMLDIKNGMDALDKALIIMGAAPRHAPKVIIDNTEQTMNIKTMTPQQICESVSSALPN